MSREELMNLVWNDSFVEEANLTHHISALRKVLGEDKNSKRFIETIPRKGYRFVTELKDAADKTGAEIFIDKRARVQVVEETNFNAGEILTGQKKQAMLPHVPQARAERSARQ